MAGEVGERTVCVCVCRGGRGGGGRRKEESKLTPKISEESAKNVTHFLQCYLETS